MSYAVKEIYRTLQGEGVHTGRAAVFVRLSGCNLWNGREEERDTAVCDFCDTDFVGTDGPEGGRYDSAVALVSVASRVWGPDPAGRFVVLTGGEPALQLDDQLVAEFKRAGFFVAIETNGTRSLPAGIDWVCVSPKGTTALSVTRGDELKLVYPQPDAPPERFERLDFDHFTLQPMDSLALEANTAAAADYCMAHPRWKLGLQVHKALGIP